MTKKGWDFNKIIDRSDTKAIKWDKQFMEMYFGEGELLPLWVADMDFRAPDVLINALKKRVEHGIFGYTNPGDSYNEAVINWFKKRHNWIIKKEWIQYSPGIVPAINFIIQTFSRPGDKVIIQEPVYYPFRDCIEKNGRQVLNNELKIEKKRYLIDFKDLREKCETYRTKMLILCNPHNPVSRVWTKEELTQLGEICIENNVLVISDEIHCDLIFPGHKHIPFSTISQEFADNTLICTAPSKTFNIAGLKASNIIIPNKELKKEFETTMNNVSIRGPTIFGDIALETVYNKCEDWLDALLIYIKDNYDFLVNFIEEHFPNALVHDLEGTYLAWVDFRELKLDPKELDEIIKKEAKVALDDGAMFGKSGGGFQRINLACPKSILHEALKKIYQALKDYIK